jgi:hypothetical protein
MGWAGLHIHVEYPCKNILHAKEYNPFNFSKVKGKKLI